MKMAKAATIYQKEPMTKDNERIAHPRNSLRTLASVGVMSN